MENRLPQVLEEEVQLRLPAKSLVRFKSVCKRWRSRFESRPFIDLYAQRHPRSPFNNFSSESPTSSFQELCQMFPGLDHWYNDVGCRFWWRDYRVFGPLSNGIYCVISFNTLASNNSRCLLSAKIALCNPATRQHEFAQHFPRKFRDMLFETSPPDPTLPPSRLFFGFGGVCKKQKVNDGSEALDYRFVAIIHYGTKMPYSFLVFVYSFLKRKWSKIVEYRAGRKKIGKPKALAGFDLPQGRIIINIVHPIETCPRGFFKGCYHWTVFHQDHSYSVLAFRFANQSFKLLRGPPSHMDFVLDEGVTVMDYSCPLVFHDHLAMIRYFDMPALSSTRTVEISIWMMMEYDVEDSWTRIYTVNPDFNSLLYFVHGIDYEEDPCANEGSGGIHIKGLLLEVQHDDVEDLVYCDNNGGHRVITSTPGCCQPLLVHRLADDYVSVVGTTFVGTIQSWSCPGISTYIESLEPICPPDVKIVKRTGSLAQRLHMARTRSPRIPGPIIY